MTTTEGTFGSECPICLEQSAKNVRCHQCHEQTCLNCAVRFFESDAMEPQCMHCRQPWSREFLYQAIPFSKWSPTMRSQRKTWMFQREKARLIDAQQANEEYRKADELRAEAVGLQVLIEDMKREMENKRAVANQWERRANQTLDPEFHQGERDPFDQTEPPVDPKNEAPPVPCPMDDCRGFVVRGVCKMCETRVCSRCMCPKTGEDHVCDEDQVKTVESFKRRTKRCPNCSALSQKIDGCDQVFCWGCKRSWEWSTQKLVDKNAWQHAPDYYRYLRETQGSVPRAPGDVPVQNGCRDPFHITQWFYMIANHRIPRNSLGAMGTERTHVSRLSEELLRAVGHYEDQLRQGVQQKPRGYLRLKFLRKEIDESRWKRELSALDKKEALEQAVLDWKRAFNEGALSFMEDIIERHVVPTLGDQIYGRRNYEQFSFEKSAPCLKQFSDFARCMRDAFEDIKTGFKSKRANPLEHIIDITNDLASFL